MDHRDCQRHNDREALLSRARQLVLVVACVCVFALDAAAMGAPTRVEGLVRNALQLDADAARGEKNYRQHCTSCHGAAALGDAHNVIPSLAGQRQAYLIKQFADFAELERDSEEMHRVVSRTALNDAQTWADLAAYLSDLPPLRFPETADGSGVELGEAIYQRQCASCHAEDARGDDDGFVPSLRDQHYSYLVRQTRSLAAFHRLNVDADLVRFLDSLDTEEITAVADYLARLRGPVRDRATLQDDGALRH